MHHDHGYWKSSHPEVVDGDEEVSPVQFLNPRDLLRNPLQNELQQVCTYRDRGFSTAI